MIVCLLSSELRRIKLPSSYVGKTENGTVGLDNPHHKTTLQGILSAFYR